MKNFCLSVFPKTTWRCFRIFFIFKSMICIQSFINISIGFTQLVLSSLILAMRQKWSFLRWHGMYVDASNSNLQSFAVVYSAINKKVFLCFFCCSDMKVDFFNFYLFSKSYQTLRSSFIFELELGISCDSWCSNKMEQHILHASTISWGENVNIGMFEWEIIPKESEES
jgi:hypothetical protein